MKIKKLLILSLFLIIGLLLFIPNAVNAETTIDKVIIDFDGAVPVVGEEPKDIVIDSEKYEIVYQEWNECDEDGNVTDNKVATFEFGETYLFTMYIKANAGYTFSETIITTKNIAWDASDGVEDDGYDKRIVTDPGHKYQGCVFIQGHYTVGTVHDEIELDRTSDIIPIIGKTPQYLNIASEEYEIFSQEWYDENNNLVSTFEAGKEYRYTLALQHNTAYGWDSLSTLTLNNIDWIQCFSRALLTDGTLWFVGDISPVEGFEIKIEPAEGVNIGQDGPLVVPKGYGRNLHFQLEDGYKITSVKVNGVEQTLPLKNNELSFNNIQEDINVVIETEKVEIEELKQINLTEDSINQEFIKGTDEFLAFTLINNQGTGKVFIDGIELNKDNGDYGWGHAENLPYIKISETYLTKLKSGKHTIKFVIENVGEAETTFTIVEPEDKENNNDDNKGNVPSNDNNNTNNGNANIEGNNSNNPQTGDNIMLYVAILGISTMGIVVTTIVRKKLQNN